MSHDAHFTHAHMVRFDWPLAATPDQVWAVLTDFTRLPGWYGNGTLEGKVGGSRNRHAMAATAQTQL
jgi:uncharacterized protein YndB with AHSA1/START domain